MRHEKLTIFPNILFLNLIKITRIKLNSYGDWGLGIGDWGLGIGAHPQHPITNFQKHIPHPPST